MERRLLGIAVNLTLAFIVPFMFTCVGWVSGWFCGYMFPETFAKAFDWADVSLTVAESGAVLGWFSGFFVRYYYKD